MHLHANGSSARLPDGTRSPEILILQHHQVEFDGKPCDSPDSRGLPELRARIRAHMAKPEAATIILQVKPEAQYARMVDVLNALAACGCARYHMVILPP